MPYHIKAQGGWFVAWGGESLTKVKAHRAVFATKALAKWYVAGTNVFGDLTVVPAKRKTK